MRTSRAIPRNLLTNLFSDISIQPVMWMRLARLGGVGPQSVRADPDAARAVDRSGRQQPCDAQPANLPVWYLRNSWNTGKSTAPGPSMRNRALSSRRCGKKQVFEAMCALLTSIFVNRHVGNTVPSGGPPIFEGGLRRILFYRCRVPRTMIHCDYGPPQAPQG